MNGFYEFIGAAWPWIAIALLLAVFSVRSGSESGGNEKKSREDGGSE